MNKWFSDFLESLFRRTEPHSLMWLTAKQTAICTKYMELKIVRYDSDGYGTMYNHNNYYCNWNGREVWLSYSKKNGCGSITFGYTVEEQATLQAEYEAQKKNEEQERIERIKRNPERLEKRIAKLQKKIAALQDAWDDDKTYDDYSVEDEEYYAEMMEKYNAEMQALTT